MNRIRRNHPEFAALSPAVRTVLLAEARHEVFVVEGQAGRAGLYLLGSAVGGFLLALLFALAFSFDRVALIAGIVFGVTIALASYQWLYQGLILRGLSRVLARSEIVR